MSKKNRIEWIHLRSNRQQDEIMIADVPGGIIFRVFTDTHDLGNVADWAVFLPGATVGDFEEKEDKNGTNQLVETTSKSKKSYR